MKKYILIIGLFAWMLPAANAQLGELLKRKAGEGAKQGAQTGTEKAIDKGIDKLFKKKNKGLKTDVDSLHSMASTTDVSNGVPGNIGDNQAIPASISFDWQVDQRVLDDDGDKTKNMLYFFSTDGKVAAMQEVGEGANIRMVYLADGRTLMIDDKRKTIMVMPLRKVMGEMGMAGKEAVEKISGKPLQKDKDEDGESLDAQKTGKTKKILTYTAEEYQLTQGKGKGGLSFWYAKVPFDPVKAYTMGVGRPADLSKITNNPKLKNSVLAVPVLNTNYLWVETAMNDKKSMETLRIDKKTTTITTGGYKIQYVGGMKDMLKRDDN